MRRKYERKNPKKSYTGGLRKNYNKKEPNSDYLKFFRVVRFWAKRTHGVGLADLELLLFLYSKGLFKRADFDEFAEIFPWEKARFERLRKDGWISVWRKYDGYNAALYELSYKGKRLCLSVYKKLSGEEKIAESPGVNPIFKKNPPYTDKVYKRAIKSMNKSTTLQQHPAQE